MLRKRFFGVLAVLVTGMLVIGFVGCDMGGGGGDDGGGDGWPPSSELSKFLLGGWTQPAGLSGINWGYTVNTSEYLFLQIQFSGVTVATADAINDYLTSATGGYQYSAGFPLVDGQHYHSVFAKEDATYNYAVNYTYDVPGGGGIQLLRERKGSGDPGGPILPSTFTITDCTLPTGSLVYATTANPATVLTWGSTPGQGPVESQGAGVLQANKTVAWNLGKTPANGTYTIILISMGDGTYHKATGIEINNGGGSAPWTAFSVLPMN